jgi:hypothetical protein
MDLPTTFEFVSGLADVLARAWCCEEAATAPGRTSTGSRASAPAKRRRRGTRDGNAIAVPFGGQGDDDRQQQHTTVACPVNAAWLQFSTVNVHVCKYKNKLLRIWHVTVGATTPRRGPSGGRTLRSSLRAKRRGVARKAVAGKALHRVQLIGEDAGLDHRERHVALRQAEKTSVYVAR